MFKRRGRPAQHILLANHRFKRPLLYNSSPRRSAGEKSYLYIKQWRVALTTATLTRSRYTRYAAGPRLYSC